MNMIDDEARAVARAIDRAIGYADSGPLIWTSGAYEEQFQHSLIAHSLFGLGDKPRRVLPGGYVSRSFIKPPVKNEERESSHPVPIEINAVDSSRMGLWPFLDDTERLPEERERIDAHRIRIVRRMTDNLGQALCKSLNQFTLRLLNAVVDQEDQKLKWHSSQDQIVARLRNGWSLLRPETEDAFALGYDLTRHNLKCEANASLDPHIAFLYGPPEDLGVWKRAPEVRLVAWADGRDLTYGLSALLYCGQSVLDPKLLFAVDLGTAPRLSVSNCRSPA